MEYLKKEENDRIIIHMKCKGNLLNYLSSEVEIFRVNLSDKILLIRMGLGGIYQKHYLKIKISDITEIKAYSENIYTQTNYYGYGLTVKSKDIDVNALNIADNIESALELIKVIKEACGIN